MKKLLSKYRKPNIIRAILRKTFAMLVIAVLLAVLWDRFANASGLVKTRVYVFPIFGGMFLIVAWFCFLRVDGFRLVPSLRRKKRTIRPDDLNDVIQTPLDHDEELTSEERAFCTLAASLLCSAACWLIAVI